MNMKKLIILAAIVVFTGCDNNDSNSSNTLSVKGLSMSPTLNEGDTVKVGKVEELNRGDIVFYKHPYGGKTIVSRIIGLPNESIKFENGYVLVMENNSTEWVQLEESYLPEMNQGKTGYILKNPEIFTTPENGYFILSDNRKMSVDSRAYFKMTPSEINPVTDRFYLTKEDLIGVLEK